MLQLRDVISSIDRRVHQWIILNAIEEDVELKTKVFSELGANAFIECRRLAGFPWRECVENNSVHESGSSKVRNTSSAGMP